MTRGRCATVATPAMPSVPAAWTAPRQSWPNIRSGAVCVRCANESCCCAAWPAWPRRPATRSRPRPGGPRRTGCGPRRNSSTRWWKAMRRGGTAAHNRPSENPARRGPGHQPDRTTPMTEATPDHAEEAAADFTDNIVPTRGSHLAPVVGLGGSAGAIPALQAFLRSMPADSGQAFVVVMHLSPEHVSTLPEILQHCTTMPVVQVKDRVKIEADRVYVIPPGKAIRALDSTLSLEDAALPRRGRHVTVDLFFRTLADTHGPHAAAIVLSGADSDGAIGIKRIKERGGLTVAQDPEEAEHASMPRAAIATAMVDWVLPVADMGQRLRQYFALEKKLKLPPEDTPSSATQSPGGPSEETALRDALGFLRTRTGRDFSYYK